MIEVTTAYAYDLGRIDAFTASLRAVAEIDGATMAVVQTVFDQLPCSIAGLEERVKLRLKEI